MTPTDILTFEERWPKHTGAKEAELLKLGVYPARYYQRLRQIIRTREALETHPMLVRRLLRLEHVRAVEQTRRHTIR